MSQTNQQHLLRLLQAATFCVFAGRSWQHLFWDAPYREFLWDEKWMKGVIESITSFTWSEYLTNPAVDIGIQRLVFGLGLFYALCAVVTFFIQKLPRPFRWLLVLGSASLVILSLLYLKEYFSHLGQFFEYSLQFSTPLFLFFYLKNGKVTEKMVLCMKLTIATTFTCHGLYAIGYYPRPGSYFQMIFNVTGLQMDGAIAFLNVAGLLDFTVALGIFLPWKRSKYFLMYAVFWGFATAMARILGNFFWQFPIESLYQWTHQTVYRFPHFLVPLILLLLKFPFKKESPVK